MIETVFAIVDTDYGMDGRGKPRQVVKRVFDSKVEALAALFKPYTLVELQVDTEQVLLDLHRKLTPEQIYSLSCYNELGIDRILIKGESK